MLIQKSKSIRLKFISGGISTYEPDSDVEVNTRGVTLVIIIYLRLGSRCHHYWSQVAHYVSEKRQLTCSYH